MVDLRLLRYFVAVAELEHVGRAAAALRVSQSPLSRQLRQLEEQLGLRLFDRERRRLRLTTAGRWLLGESRKVLKRAERLERDAARMARGAAASVRIGFVKSAVWTGVLPAALREFRRKHPEVAIELKSARSTVQAAAVKRGDLEIGVVHEPPLDEELVVVPVVKEPIHLALPESHALARRSSITPKSLDGVDWIVLSPSPGKNARLLAACARAGFVPQVRFEASDQSTVLGLVDAGMGLAFLPKSAERAAPPGVVLRELPWLRLARTLYAIRRRGAASPFAAELLAALSNDF